MTETSYGTWQKFNRGELSVRQGIEHALGTDLKAFDVDAIEAEFRQAINDKLESAGIKLVGDEFIGKVEECAGCLAAAPGYIAEAVALVNLNQFWDIVAKHDKG